MLYTLKVDGATLPCPERGAMSYGRIFAGLGHRVVELWHNGRPVMSFTDSPESRVNHAREMARRKTYTPQQAAYAALWQAITEEEMERII